VTSPLHPWQQKTERRLVLLETLVEFLIHDGVRAEPRGFNGQQGRQALFRELARVCDFRVLVETGTYIGDTAGWLAREFKLPVWTSEVEPNFVTVAQKRFRHLPNLQISESDARTFLDVLIATGAAKAGAFFYLDAHWGTDAPLVTELSLIARRCTEFVVMVDDFEVPGDDGYSFDDYGGVRLVAADYAKTFGELGLVAYSPTLPSEHETGARRGCVVLCREDMTARLDGLEFLRRWFP